MVENKTINISSPYYLCSSYSSGVTFVTCRLIGNNYLTWSRAMMNALRAKNKFGFIDRSLTKSDVGKARHGRYAILC